jgi:excisionase family DNA binding protein
MTTHDLPSMLTVPEVCHFLRLNRATAYEKVRTGAIPSVRIGGKVLVPRDELLATLAASKKNDERPAITPGVREDRGLGSPSHEPA